MFDASFWLWTGFVVFVLVMLFVDLAVVSKGNAIISPRKALGLTAFFVSLALAFSLVVYRVYESQMMGSAAISQSGKPLTGTLAVAEYLSVWLLEYSMSVDNLFVFTLIFGFFGIPARYQHRVLFWGILGALVLRGVMIGLGTAIVKQFEPVLLLFGLVLVWTAWKMLRSDEAEFDPSKSTTFKLVKRVMPLTDKLEGERFFVKVERGGVLVKAATPLFVVLCIVEATDLIFAVDSIPAAFGQSKEPFIIFTANVFAIMGLRSLYFAIAGLVHMFRFLKYSLAAILGFIGVKMLITPKLPAIGWDGLHVDTRISLGVIGVALAAGIVTSLLFKRSGEPTQESGPKVRPSEPSE